MSSCLNCLPSFNKKFAELKIIKFIGMFWFILVELPLRLLRALVCLPSAPSALLQIPSVEKHNNYRAASLSDVMTEAYLSKDFSPLETSEKYARLYYSPTLGLVISLIVFGTVLKLTFLRKAHLMLEGSRPARGSTARPLDVRNIPIEYDEELNTWCTLNCSSTKGRKTAVRGLPRLGLPVQTIESATIARSLMFHANRD